MRSDAIIGGDAQRHHRRRHPGDHRWRCSDHRRRRQAIIGGDRTKRSMRSDAIIGGDAQAIIGGDRTKRSMRSDAIIGGDAQAIIGGDAQAIIGGDRTKRSMRSDAIIGGDRSAIIGGDTQAIIGGDRTKRSMRSDAIIGGDRRPSSAATPRRSSVATGPSGRCALTRSSVAIAAPSSAATPRRSSVAIETKRSMRSDAIIGGDRSASSAATAETQRAPSHHRWRLDERPKCSGCRA